MTRTSIKLQYQPPVAMIVLNRPEVRNAVSLTKGLLAEINGLSLREALRLAATTNTLSRVSPDFG